jgi:hypothetical protein
VCATALLSARGSVASAASSASPPFSPTDANLSPEQQSVVAAAKEAGLEAVKATVSLMQIAYDRVRTEYTVADDWLKEEYPEIESDDDDGDD